MPTDAPGTPAPPPKPAAPAGPMIAASRGHVLVTGIEFLPNHPITVRISQEGEDIDDYLAYTTDGQGHLNATLPATAVTKTAYITASDHRPNPRGEQGLLWSNTVVVPAGD